MNIGNGSGGGGSVSTATFLDYLRPEIDRPDIYEERSFIVKDIHGSASTDSNKNSSSKKLPVYTIGIIILSAIIFIVAVSWTDVIRSWFDTKYVNEIIEDQFKSRLYFAITITIIGSIIIFIMWLLWYFSF